jgi:hypothetical protein
MYAADGGTRQNSGVLRIASSVLHILPQTTVAPDSGAPAALVIGQKAAQERFSEESFRYFTYLLTTSPETHFSKALPKVPAHSTGTHGTQQAWINSRNLTNIATGWKHRQPIFLHPTVGTGAIRPSRSLSTLDCHSLREVLLSREGSGRAVPRDYRAFGSLPHTNAAAPAC